VSGADGIRNAPGASDGLDIEDAPEGAVAHIAVNTGGRPYEVQLGDGVLDRVGDTVRARTRATAAALVTDERVAELYGPRVEASLAAAGIEVSMVTVPAGEASKDWAVAGAVLEELAAARLDRTAAVVALGGGVVGDLAGFCAAVYLRGIPFVQVPTTLLAQVDSSVGGKTGVDLPQGKNLAGAFWQPVSVLADTTTFATLPELEWQSGLAEVAKAAFLDSERFVSALEAATAGGQVPRDGALTHAIVADSILFKARVVASDERESGDREVLNYGHTFGHALEKVLGYGTLTHGHAVAEGIRFAARLAEDVAGAPPAWTRRQGRLLDHLGLTAIRREVDPGRLGVAMRSDKKVRGGEVRFVLCTGPGAWETRRVDEATIAYHLAAWAASAEGEERP
jgi:3-dehydroquinate synthase